MGRRRRGSLPAVWAFLAQLLLPACGLHERGPHHNTHNYTSCDGLPSETCVDLTTQVAPWDGIPVRKQQMDGLHSTRRNARPSLVRSL